MVIRWSANVLVILLAAAPASAEDLSVEQLARLKAGDALVSVAEDTGGADGHIEAAIEIPASPHRVWQVMTDCARAPKFVAGLKSCRIVEQEPDGKWDIREHRSQWMSMMPETISVFRSDYTLDKEILFQRVSGTLKFLQGSWRLQPLNNGTRTRLRYSVRSGVAAPVPGFMIRSALEADVPKLLKALRAETASGR